MAFTLMRIELRQDSVSLILLVIQACQLLSNCRERATNDGVDLGNHRFVSCLDGLALSTGLFLRSCRGVFPCGKDSKIPRFSFGTTIAGILIR